MPPLSPAPHRDRLLAAMEEAIVTVGYDALTVADVVRRAHVSKRTFYEHFAGKAGALLALYEANSTRLLRGIEAAIDATPAGGDGVRAGVEAYLAELQAHPAVVRTMVVAILRTGPEGLAVRRAVNRQFAALLARELAAAGQGGPHAPTVAMALVGGVNELLLEMVEADQTDRLGDLVEPVTALLRPFFAPSAGTG